MDFFKKEWLIAWYFRIFDKGSEARLNLREVRSRAKTRVRIALFIVFNC
jgi:hypothetical protein